MSYDPALVDLAIPSPATDEGNWWVGLSLDQLTDPALAAFWAAPTTQDAILATEVALRRELVDAERASLADAPVFDLAAAREGGPRTPVYEALARHLYRRALTLANLVSDIKGPGREAIAARVVNEFLGLGPIAPIVQDPLVTDVMVNAAGVVFFDRGGQRFPVPAARFRDAQHLSDVVERYLLAMNRQLTSVTPLVDGRLPDGSRINVTHQVVTGEVTVTIRRFPVHTWTLVDLIARGAMSEELALELGGMVRGRLSLLVAGGTGTGKTTLLNAISGCAHVTDRIVTVEDSRELRLHPAATNVVHMQARPGTATLEPLTMKDLVRNALRMYPDRIIVGEVRDGVVVDMLQAASTGHEGSMSTIHANTVPDTIHRIVMLSAQSGVELSDARVRDAIGVAIDVIVAVQRFPDGTRRVTEVTELLFDRDTHTIAYNPLWVWSAATGAHVKCADLTEERSARQRAQSPEPMTRQDLDEIARAARLADADRLATAMAGRPPVAGAPAS